MLHFTEGLTVTNSINFTFSDLVAGYVQNYDQDTDVFTLRTSDGREYSVGLSDTTYAECCGT